MKTFLPFAVIAVATLSGCGRDKEPGLNLLNAGSGQKRLLRYAATAGTKYEVVMTMEMDFGMELKPPAMSFTVVIEVVKVSSEGDITCEFSFTDVRIEGGETPEELKVLLDITGTAVVDSRGVNQSGSFNVPDSADPALKQMVGKFEEQLRQMSCPFPHEEVAIGAKWEVVQNIDTPALSLSQTATFELVELDGNRGKLKVTMTQSADDQEMKLPGGVTATLESLRSKGTGELEFDLTKPVPVNSFLELSSDIHMKIKDETHRQKIGIKITLKEK